MNAMATQPCALASPSSGTLQIIFTLPTVLYLDKFGRETFLIVGATGMFLVDSEEPDERNGNPALCPGKSLI
jgi:hypothetical protein